MLQRLCFILLFACSASCQAATKVSKPVAVPIFFRHALEGDAAVALAEMVDRYNYTSKDGKIVLQHVSMAGDLHKLPHLALLNDDEYQKFFDSRPRMLPLYKVMAEAKEKFATSDFYPVLVDNVDDSKGRLLALPLAQSVPVLYYNRDALLKAGADIEHPPKTWREVQQVAGKLFDAGYLCPYTSSDIGWIQIENLATQHNQPLVASVQAGKASSTRLSLNGMVEVKHIALLSSWYKSQYFHYFGRGREADAKFAAGECSMLTSDSSLYAQLARTRPFDVGVAPLPYYEDVYGVVPGRVLPDGPILRVLAGKKSSDYKAVAHFVAYLLQPDVQKEWVKATGFLPLTPAALDTLATEGAPAEVLRAVVGRLSEKSFVTAARPKTMIGMDRVHTILGEELEAVWANRKPAKEALDDAVTRGNAVLRPAPPEGR